MKSHFPPSIFSSTVSTHSSNDEKTPSEQATLNRRGQKEGDSPSKEDMFHRCNSSQSKNKASECDHSVRRNDSKTEPEAVLCGQLNECTGICTTKVCDPLERYNTGDTNDERASDVEPNGHNVWIYGVGVVDWMSHER